MLIGLILAAAVSAAGPVLVQPGERPAYDALVRKTVLEAADTFRGSACPDARVEVIFSQSVFVPGNVRGNIW